MSRVGEKVIHVTAKLTQQEPKPESARVDLQGKFGTYLSEAVQVLVSNYNVSDKYRKRNKSIAKGEKRVAGMAKRRECASCFALNLPDTFLNQKGSKRARVEKP